MSNKKNHSQLEKIIHNSKAAIYFQIKIRNIPVVSLRRLQVDKFVRKKLLKVYALISSWSCTFSRKGVTIPTNKAFLIRHFITPNRDIITLVNIGRYKIFRENTRGKKYFALVLSLTQFKFTVCLGQQGVNKKDRNRIYYGLGCVCNRAG